VRGCACSGEQPMRVWSGEPRSRAASHVAVASVAHARAARVGGAGSAEFWGQGSRVVHFCTHPRKEDVQRGECKCLTSSIALSSTSYSRWCRPRCPVLPMYMPGRLRTGSRPSSTCGCVRAARVQGGVGVAGWRRSTESLLVCSKELTKAGGGG